MLPPGSFRHNGKEMHHENLKLRGYWYNSEPGPRERAPLFLSLSALSSEKCSTTGIALCGRLEPVRGASAATGKYVFAVGLLHGGKLLPDDRQRSGGRFGSKLFGGFAKDTEARAQEQREEADSYQEVRPSSLEQPDAGRCSKDGKALINVIAGAFPNGGHVQVVLLVWRQEGQAYEVGRKV